MSTDLQLVILQATAGIASAIYYLAFAVAALASTILLVIIIDIRRGK